MAEAGTSLDSGARPTIAQRIVDQVAVTLHGGVRVRILRRAEGVAGVVVGYASEPSPQQILETVLEVGPAGPGTVDLVKRSRGGWTVRARGALASRALEQRLRNVLAIL